MRDSRGCGGGSRSEGSPAHSAILSRSRQRSNFDFVAERESQIRECVHGHIPGTAQELRNVRLGSSDQSGEIGLTDLLLLHESRNQLRSLKRERFTLIDSPTFRVGNEILEVILQLRHLFLAPRSVKCPESSFLMRSALAISEGGMRSPFFLNPCVITRVRPGWK
jgi:hypothetical protein